MITAATPSRCEPGPACSCRTSRASGWPPGDRIGLVGRNGAGKTTLTKILAGGGPARGRSDPPAVRRGRLPAAGPTDRRPADHRPRPDAVGARARHDRTPSSRGRDRMASEKPRSSRSARCAATNGPEAELHRRGGYAAESEAAQIAESLATRASACSTSSWHALGWSAPSHRADPHPVLRCRDPAPRRADQPPRRRLDRLAARPPQGLPRRAGGDLATTSGCWRPWSTRCSTSTPTGPRSTTTAWADGLPRPA